MPGAACGCPPQMICNTGSRGAQTIMKLGESEVEVATRDGKGKNLVKHWIGYIRTAVGNRTVSSVMLALLSSLALFAQSEIPEWCRALPRREYKALERVAVSDTWFEVYKVAPGVFAIYEPHQSEEVISYLIVGDKRALLFDTGMGISDIKKVVSELSPLPIAVLNSHTHNDHVGGNWEFSDVYGMDTEFTRKNALGSREDAQAEIIPDQICGTLPAGFDPNTYSTRAWKIKAFMRDGDKFDLGGRTIEVLATPGHTPDAIALIDRGNGLLFTGDTYYPA